MKKNIILTICLILNICCFAQETKTNKYLTHLKTQISHPKNDTLYINTYQLTIKEIDSVITSISIVNNNHLENLTTTSSLLEYVNTHRNDYKTKYKLLNQRIKDDQDKIPNFSPPCGNVMQPRKKYSSQKDAIATYISNLNDINFNKALYLIDYELSMQPMKGKLEKRKFLKKLRKTKISEIIVWPLEQGISIYGTAAKNGLILIRSEKYSTTAGNTR